MMVKRGLWAAIALAALVIVAAGHGAGTGAVAADAPVAAPRPQVKAAGPPGALSTALSALSIAERRRDRRINPAVEAVAVAYAKTAAATRPPAGAPVAAALDGVRATALGGLLDAADWDGVLIPFGAAGRDGRLSTGMTVSVAPGGVLYAPRTARVGFAGPLDGYGPVLILVSDADEALVLTGLDRALVAEGQTVTAGAAIAVMDGGDRDAGDQDGGDARGGDEAGLTTTATPKPELYVEVRMPGRVVDPASWLRQRREIVFR